MDSNAELFGDLPVRSATQRLVTNLLFDLPLDPPLIVDFGIDSAKHYRALRAAVFNDVEKPESADLAEDDAMSSLQSRVQELDAVYGNGCLLNALVEKYAPEYADAVKFQTSWDAIYGRTNPLSDSKE